MTKTDKISPGDFSLRAAIEEACAGLNYISETDAPVEPFYVPQSYARSMPLVIEKLEKDFGERSEIKHDEFFAGLTKNEAWHESHHTASVTKFKALHDLFAEHLDAVRVYKFGRVRREILVFGQSSEGDIAGIRTRAVET